MSPDLDENKFFIIDRGQIADRIDTFFWQPKFRVLDKVFERHHDWTVRLGAVATGITNGDHGGVEYTADGVRYLRGQAISEFGLDLDKDQRFIAESEHFRMVRAEVVPGDVLFTIAGSIGNACVVEGVDRANINQAIARIKPLQRILPQYLSDFLNTSFGRLQSRRVANGGVQLNINFAEVRALRLLVPPLDVQKRFVAELATARKIHDCALVEATRLLDSIDDYLLGELGIVLPAGQENTISSRIFAANWKDISGSRIDPGRYTKYHQSLRKVVGHGKYPSIRLMDCIVDYVSGDWGASATDIQDELVDYEECLVLRNTEFDNDFNLRVDGGRAVYRYIKKSKLKRLDIQPHDILVEKSGGSPDQPVGRAAYLNESVMKDRQVGFSNFLVKIRARVSVISPLFLFIWLKSSHRLKITESMQAQTNGIRNLIMNEYFGQLIPIPDSQAQQRICKVVTDLMETAQALRVEAVLTLESSKLRIEASLLGDAL